jgi:O-antigen ligase
MAWLSTRRLIDAARSTAILACVGILYSPSVATIGLIACYLAFVASGKEAVARCTAAFERPMVYWGLVFLGAVAIGMLYASVPWQERWTDLYKWRTILWFMVVLALFDEERWKDRLLVIFIAATAVAVVGSFLATAGWVRLWRDPHELLRNAGTQGMAFGSAALMCAWLTLERKSLGVPRWVWPLLGLLYVANIVFITDARSGYAVLGLGAVILVSGKVSGKQRVAVLAGLLIVGGLAFAVSSRMQAKMTAAVVQWTDESESKQITSFGSRRVFYSNSLEMLGEHWATGVGTGGFAQAYREHIANKYEPSDWRAVPATDPHNQYLAIALQQGIVGVGLFLVWIVSIAREREADRNYHRLAVAILAGWCVTSLFSSHFRTFAEGHLLATFLGVLLAAQARGTGAQAVSELSSEA